MLTRPHDSLFVSRPERPARILVAIQPRDGGAAGHVRMLIDWLAAEQVEVHLLCDPAFDGLDQLDERVVRHLAPMRRRPSVGDVRLIRQIAALLEREDFDVVHAHSAKAGALIRLAGRLARTTTPVVYTPHVFPFRNRSLPAPARSLYRRVERSLARHTDAIVTLSAAEHADAAALSSLPRVVRARNGVPAPAVGDRVGTADRPVVGFVGRLSIQKGVDQLIRAAALTSPRVEFWLVGAGPESRRLHRLAVRLGVSDRVRFLGERADVYELMNQMDIVAVPSRFEAQPLVVLEAMMAAKAVVASDIDGIRDLVDDGRTGVLAPPENPKALAAAIEALLENPARRAELGSAAAAWARANASIDAMVADHRELYRSLTGHASFASPDRRIVLEEAAPARLRVEAPA